jgi:protein-S-isoprenylcysteine O-methyltransferase Ste14
MTILDQFVRDGDRLFRWRSYFPLLLVPALVAGILIDGSPFADAAIERVWEAAAVLVALAGLAVRAWAVGTAPAGTSERSTSSPRAAMLRTTGLYSTVRHPLYLANALMALGIALFPGLWYLPVITVLATMVYYERIAAREEAFLAEQFGGTFRDWAARVPAIVPRLSGYVPSAAPVSWRKILRGEFHGLLVIAAGVAVLDACQAWRRHGTALVDPLWAWVAGVSAALFLVSQAVKKGTRWFDDRR